MLSHTVYIVRPNRFILPYYSAVRANGSSSSGHCSQYSINSQDEIICTLPSTSVLFNDKIPTLTGLDGDMWASQLLTLRRLTSNTEITFDFITAPVPDVGRVEVVMFNCPEWGIVVESILLFGAESSVHPYSRNVNILAFKNISDDGSSCDSLLRVCLAIPPTTKTSLFILEFVSGSPALNWTYLAEITFYYIGDDCPPDAIITTNPTTSGNVQTSWQSDNHAYISMELFSIQ